MRQIYDIDKLKDVIGDRTEFISKEFQENLCKNSCLVRHPSEDQWNEDSESNLLEVINFNMFLGN